MELVGPEGQTGAFSSSNEPQSRIFGFDISAFFCRNFSWTPVKTLVMEPVGPEGQTGAFSSSNEPQSRVSFEWRKTNDL
ncbi:hypothetical protein H5410_041750 [Solanum commersonii]|uniref:Uncharacterized protein n=1 Tax=Solanum commersonii TaxID=4109 RepID=A0A9J5XVG9_SOLCO|nr:hypothetical protein H5410_041750 [Solanum commersonii]